MSFGDFGCAFRATAVFCWFLVDDFAGRRELKDGWMKFAQQSESRSKQKSIAGRNATDVSKKSPTRPTERTPKKTWVSNSSIATYWTESVGKVPFNFWWNVDLSKRGHATNPSAYELAMIQVLLDLRLVKMVIKAPTLLETNVSHPMALWKMCFLFPRWDMLVPQRLVIFAPTHFARVCCICMYVCFLKTGGRGSIPGSNCNWVSFRLVCVMIQEVHLTSLQTL